MDGQSKRLSELQCHTPTKHEQQSEQSQADSTEAPECSSYPPSTYDYAEHRYAGFAFPTLSPDGSVDDLTKSPFRRYPPTPPAALSSLGWRSINTMADPKTMTDSTTSFSDSQYDMVDDLSEISNDDHDTASLASTEHVPSDDGIVTPEEDFSEGGAQLDEEGELVQSMTESEVELEKESGEVVHKPSGRDTVEIENDALDSYLSEDLETPRQSTMPTLAQSLRRPQKFQQATTALESRKSSASFPRCSILLIVKTTLAIAAVVLQVYLPLFISNPVAEHANRKHALSSAVLRLTNSTDATRSFSIDHLLPEPTATSVDVFGRTLYSIPSQVHYAPLQPNHVIVSIPRGSVYIMSSKIQSVRAHKGTRDIAYSQIKIIDGVYDIAIDPAEAHGTVDIEGIMVHPKSAFTIQHNFGNRLLQRQTYEKARTDLSKSVTKDIALASDTARTYSERLQMELLAGAAATKNVTTQLAVQMTRDLQIFVNAATSMVGKVDQAINKTAHAVGKDLAVMSRDVVAFGRSVRKSITATKQTAQALVPTKNSVTSPLKLSHERAVGFSEKLFGGKRKVKSLPTTKELSTRVQDFVKSITPARKWKKTLSMGNQKSLSTVPGKGLTTPKKTGSQDGTARQSVKVEKAAKQADAGGKPAELKKGVEKKLVKESANAMSKLQKGQKQPAKR
ncbi:hypothetical protein B0A55_06099 [Friedmanniomyces simplex]|uniref:Uncharacterized protein n=1 Tax=Friedmanniomyces simplex TaxID=329884 RepID=A0A4U0XM32_9PEZI|nr:hypothetical protein B0A55_06099 [Friedmanniomyces simplex]